MMIMVVAVIALLPTIHFGCIILMFLAGA